MSRGFALPRSPVDSSYLAVPYFEKAAVFEVSSGPRTMMVVSLHYHYHESTSGNPSKAEYESPAYVQLAPNPMTGG